MDSDAGSHEGDAGGSQTAPGKLLTRATIERALLVAVGLFGLAILWLAARAIVDGTTTQATPFAGLFGAGAVAFAVWELARQ